jgi:uncharacterized protein YecE (DUF72 family)
MDECAHSFRDLAQIWILYYSKIFDFVEIDSTFYKIPSKFMVNNWNKEHQKILNLLLNFQEL